MVSLLLLAGALLAVLLSGFFSGTEMGVYALNNVRLRVDSSRGNHAARRLLPLTERFEWLVITALVGTNIADYLAAALITALWLRAAVSTSTAELYTTAIVTPAILVFGNILPKERFRRRANRMMYACSIPLAVWMRVVRLTGLLAALMRLTRGLLRFIDPVQAEAERDLLPRARMRKLLLEGAERGGLSTFQRETFERVMSLARTRVARVMIPRPRVAMVSADLPRADFLRIARMAHFSRLPVYRGNPRHIIGVVNVFDVLTDEAERPIAELARDAVRLNAGHTVPAALRKLQRAHEAMAIVCNRRGDCLGVLTIKDLVEEIVGDLEAW